MEVPPCPRYARVVGHWIRSIGLEATCLRHPLFETHQAAQIYKKTGNIRAVQLLLGHSKLESTVRYLCIKVDNAIAIAEQIEL